jgi:hypothetical protein
MKPQRPNTSLLFIVGILMVLFIIPFVLALITLVAYGEFAVPTDLFGGVLGELDANFVLALLMTILPLLMVWAIETRRGQAGGARRSVGLTLGLLVALVAIVTAVPLLAFFRPLSRLPAGQALAIVSCLALPLLVVIFAVAIVLPGHLRQEHGDDQ